MNGDYKLTIEREVKRLKKYASNELEFETANKRI